MVRLSESFEIALRSRTCHQTTFPMVIAQIQSNISTLSVDRCTRNLRRSQEESFRSQQGHTRIAVATIRQPSLYRTGCMCIIQNPSDHRASDLITKIGSRRLAGSVKCECAGETWEGMFKGQVRLGRDTAETDITQLRATIDSTTCDAVLPEFIWLTYLPSKPSEAAFHLLERPPGHVGHQRHG